MQERIVRSRNATYLRELENYFRTHLVDDYADRSASLWQRDYTSSDSYRSSVATMRRAWRDVLAPPQLEVAGEPEITAEWIDGVQSYWIQQPLRGGLRAQGLFAIPPGGASHLVVFQHGLGSTPERAFGVGDPEKTYDEVALRLLEAGYAVLAPQNLSFVDPRNRAQRLARLAGTTMEGLELSRLQILLDLIADRFDLNLSQMGLWGSSWGGLATQVWAPLDERFEVAITSGFFNNRQHKMVIEDPRYSSFERKGEDHAFLPGHLWAFADADLASLICPRAFMVQMGELDGIGWWPQVVDEYERARVHWDQLGLGERADIDLHKDGHVVRAAPGVTWMQRWLP